MKKILSLTLILLLLLSGCDLSGSSAQGLTVHFLDVGQADCILLECEGEYLLIDGGNREDGQFVVSYLEQQGVETLNAVICTHAHEDHVGGLPSVLAVYPTEAILAPTRTYASKVFDDFLRYADQQRVEVDIPSPGDAFSLGGAEIRILGPVKSYAETNNSSIVVQADYGESSFLFTGDMEVTAETDMLDYWEEKLDWQVDVLKVGHHGSDTSTGYRFLYELDPAYGVISVGTGNSYGHPHEEPLSRLWDAGVTLLRTDRLGTILAHSDGREITFTWENQNASPETGEEITYIGNKNTKKFHTDDCPSLPAEKNRVEFPTRQAALDAGYTPCGTCLE